MSTQIQNQQNTLPADIVASLIINGDLGKLSPQQKVDYYRQFCERLGLDPLGQPFKLLRLNGKEIMYCDRSGAQQLNKIHKVSHEIKAREVISDCYVVTAKAFLPDDRCTESIGAVNISGMKGESLCNAMMKAETKAKRRATLDLLGLGMLDESETDTLPNAQRVQPPIASPIDITPTESESDTKPNIFVMKYDTAEEVEATLKLATTIKDLANLYYLNAEIVEANPELKAAISEKKNIFYASTNNQPKAAN